MDDLIETGFPPRTDLHRVLEETGKAIIGQRRVLREILVAVMTRGHVLLEGVPGTAKTTIVKTLARTLGGACNRIQFTPDLMPSDVIGTNVFNLSSQEFMFHPGPVFADFVLADEINRTPPKTQAALLEAMQERQVTVDGRTRELSPVFTVVATQNPVEYEGTYPLPEAQLDRFLMKVRIGYPEPEEERRLLERFHEGFSPDDLDAIGVRPVLSVEQLRREQERVTAVKVEPGLFDYLLRIVNRTRESPHISLGASPRAGIALLRCCKASAALEGRDFVTPDDIKAMCHPVLRHRLILRPESEIEGMTADDEIRNVLESVEVPR